MKSQKGVAIITAIFFITMIVWIASELTYETTVEYSIHSRSVAKLQAYYNAKSGIELSLLRIKLYKQARQQFGEQMGGQAGLLNMIWSFPLVWPPTLGEEALSMDKENLEGKVSASSMQGSFMTSISDEGSKLDLNDLASPSEKIRELTKTRLQEWLEFEFRENRQFAETIRPYNPQTIIGHIKDWVDPDTESTISGDERSYYPNTQPSLPPNRGFRTLDEITQVRGVNPAVYSLLKDKVTVYGQRAINPNTAQADILMGLDPFMTKEIVAEIIKRRDNPLMGGPFKNTDEFWSFVMAQGARITPERQAEIPLIFDNVLSFRIKSSGEFRGNTHQIEVVVWDLQTVAKTLADQVNKELQTTETQTPTTNPTKGSNPQTMQDKGPPPIVYWSEL